MIDTRWVVMVFLAKHRDQIVLFANNPKKIVRGARARQENAAPHSKRALRQSSPNAVITARRS